jgi:DNA-directed RNA polymerase subunit beta
LKEIQHASKKASHVVDIPNLVELQLDSYRWFLEEGLKELFESFSPIYDYTGNSSISLVDFTLGEPKYSIDECRDRDMTFESPVKARVRLTQANKEIIESDVYLGDLPLMTEKGTFVINGAERVVVSQLARSPGVYFKDNLDFSGRVLYYATVIPNEGGWVDIESDANSVISVRIGQARKFPITTLLRALSAYEVAKQPLHISVADAREHLWVYRKSDAEVEGNAEKDYILPMVLERSVIDKKTGEVIAEAGARIVDTHEDVERQILLGAKEGDFTALSDLQDRLTGNYILSLVSPCETNSDIIQLFSQKKRMDREEMSLETLVGKRVAEDLTDARGEKIILKKFSKIDKTTANSILKSSRQMIDIYLVNPYIEATMEQDDSASQSEALLDIYRKARPGDPATADSSRNFLQNQFFDMRKYDLARVGRYKMNKKLLGVLRHTKDRLPLEARNITREDLISIVRYIINLNAGVGTTDDIDHLENKRIRSVGELLTSQLRMGFLRMEKVAKERMTSMDNDSIIPQVILSVKPISASIKSFFGSSQLSQFMDQTNPLAELTHKRRLSALGPGGLSRQSAKLEVRDVHHSHYGRICPIETPEGPNIGLIGSMAIHARVDRYGFLETPYRRVRKGVVTDEIEWMTADIDHRYHIAPANEPLDEHNKYVHHQIQVRYEEQYPVVRPDQVEYMDVSPRQIVSVATALIPFLENDDASRALMGANMQRQAVPTLRPDAPIVKSGIERRAARDSGAVIIARREGTVVRVTADEIVVQTENGHQDHYRLMNMLRSNHATCITQRPLINKGQRVRKGQVLADGPCTDEGELALGQNVLVAFMPWGGYNYEDAILLSERLVKDDIFTSIHIEKYEKEARDTKLGPEEITRDIPNVGEDMLKDLDENGIIRIGAEVRPEDILVGEVAPKGQGELTAEERLIIAIFGKKAEETRDVSLRVPHGEKGKVVDVKVFSRFKYQCVRCKTIYNFSKRPERTTCERCEGEMVRLPADELNAGVNQLVRVYIAQKRKIMEGDKMAGRHGNKGVISKILPEEDMPFLPDGTPVDIVLNPLGVPSRMNIGQILETHLGIVGKHLNCTFVNPAFEGATDRDILSELDRLGIYLRRKTLTNYLQVELGLTVDFDDITQQEKTLDQIADAEEVRKTVSEMTDRMIGHVKETLQRCDSDQLERISSIVNGPVVRNAVRIEMEHPGVSEQVAAEIVPDESAENIAIADFDYDALTKKIIDNAWIRSGIDPNSGKCYLRNGLTGDMFDQPVTVGYIYMLKLAHLVDDKIHARSTGPYSLVTQQPLGGKAQFGGQRFGEMEVWALEAYGAAYCLQEILTIKSDDVLGRVKTYEAIVKGDNMLEPGVPESFKILVNELQSLGLKVAVEDDQDREIDLKDHDDEIDPHEDPVKAAARLRAKKLGRSAMEENDSIR